MYKNAYDFFDALDLYGQYIGTVRMPQDTIKDFRDNSKTFEEFQNQKHQWLLNRYKKIISKKPCPQISFKFSHSVSFSSTSEHIKVNPLFYVEIIDEEKLDNFFHDEFIAKRNFRLIKKLINTSNWAVFEQLCSEYLICKNEKFVYKSDAILDIIKIYDKDNRIIKRS